jgi:hypothetical protein
VLEAGQVHVIGQNEDEATGRENEDEAMMDGGELMGSYWGFLVG